MNDSTIDMASLSQYIDGLYAVLKEYKTPWNSHQNTQKHTCLPMRYFFSSENMKGYEPIAG
ncbi:MAG: hypothetical protein ACRDE8_06535 [Ginsengibacter sp.]